MRQEVGYVLEKIGRSVSKLMLFRKVGEIEVTVEVQKSPTVYKYVNGHVAVKDGRLEVVSEAVVVKEKQRIVKWALVAQHYFGFSEYFWEYRNKCFWLKPENETYVRGEVHVHQMDFDTGAALNLSGFTFPPENPSFMKQLVSTLHLKQLVEQGKPQAQWLWLAVGAVIGGAVCFIIAQFIHFPSSAPAPVAEIINLLL